MSKDNRDDEKKQRKTNTNEWFFWDDARGGPGNGFWLFLGITICVILLVGLGISLWWFHTSKTEQPKVEQPEPKVEQLKVEQPKLKKTTIKMKRTPDLRADCRSESFRPEEFCKRKTGCHVYRPAKEWTGFHECLNQDEYDYQKELEFEHQPCPLIKGQTDCDLYTQNRCKYLKDGPHNLCMTTKSYDTISQELSKMKSLKKM